LPPSLPPHKDEDTEEGAKIAVKITVARISNEELLFLKQIGLRWLHADFGNSASYDEIRTARERFALYGLKIDCALMEGYRSLKIQLGHREGMKISINLISSLPTAVDWAFARVTSIFIPAISIQPT
jgi:hypothetical protein